MKFVNPKNDVAFKKIFGSEDKSEVLISFLNAVLDLQGPDAIQSIQFRNPYRTPKLAFLKQTILDLYATDHRGFTFIVEMQVSNVAGAIKRFQYYVAKEYAGQIEIGEDYPILRPVIFIGIFDYILFSDDSDEESNTSNHLETIPEEELRTAQSETVNIETGDICTGAKPKIIRKHDYLSCHKFLDTETHAHHLKDTVFYFIELPKFTKTEDELTQILDKWIYFISNAPDLDIIPSHVQEPELRTAYTLANQFGWEKEDLEQYEYRGIRMQDERGAIQLAQDQGIEEGIDIGRQEGIDIGRQEGIDIGRQEGEEAAMLKVARNLLSTGMAIEQIIETTGLSAEQIQQLG
ncbi:MAG: Rpn family recombination-promoting nuclease/putative transposase [Chloroflexota bacterium]